MIVRTRVLVAPLDWGLGHATRCIPIIRQLIKAGFEVMIAADGAIETLIQIEFPGIQIIKLSGYNIKYSHTKKGMLPGLLRQVPHIIKTIYREHHWLKNVINIYKIDVVISDNRYGLHHKNVRSIFITHQLLIKTPFGEKILQAINYRFINKFNECWVPDFAGNKNLSGALSHPRKKPSTQLSYIGPLSRFSLRPRLASEKHVLILISGPEPQRTIFERLVFAQIKTFDQSVLVVRGLPLSKENITLSENIKVANHLAASDLEAAISEASFVIARTGYSTVMDLIKMQKKAVLIPTPGQTEQEYLGEHLNEHKLALCLPQENLNLAKALEIASTYPYQYIEANSTDLLEEVINKIRHK